MKTADLCDQYSDNLKISETSFQSYGKRKMFSGVIATVKVLDDNSLVREAIETVPPGTVIVVDGAASRKCALLGDMLAEKAVARNVAGLIINGCVRDSAELATLDLGVFALGTMPLKSVKLGKGERDVVLHFGGIAWTPGHYVYADEDGVVISETPLEL